MPIPETVMTIWSIVTNPAVQLGASALGVLTLALAGYAVKTQPKVKDVAQDLADLSEEIEPWVRDAEKLLLSGTSKYSRVLDQAQEWLKANGIVGAKGRLVQKHLPALIELAVKSVKKDVPPAAKS